MTTDSFRDVNTLWKKTDRRRYIVRARNYGRVRITRGRGFFPFSHTIPFDFRYAFIRRGRSSVSRERSLLRLCNRLLFDSSLIKSNALKSKEIRLPRFGRSTKPKRDTLKTLSYRTYSHRSIAGLYASTSVWKSKNYCCCPCFCNKLFFLIYIGSSTGVGVFKANRNCYDTISFNFERVQSFYDFMKLFNCSDALPNDRNRQNVCFLFWIFSRGQWSRSPMLSLPFLSFFANVHFHSLKIEPSFVVTMNIQIWNKLIKTNEWIARNKCRWQ